MSITHDNVIFYSFQFTDEFMARFMARPRVVVSLVHTADYYAEDTLYYPVASLYSSDE